MPNLSHVSNYNNNICEYEMSCNTEIRVHRKINVEMIYLIQRSIHALNACLYTENDFFATSTFYDKNFIFPSLYKPMRDLFDLGERARGRERRVCDNDPLISE